MTPEERISALETALVDITDAITVFTVAMASEHVTNGDWVSIRASAIEVFTKRIKALTKNLKELRGAA